MSSRNRAHKIVFSPVNRRFFVVRELKFLVYLYYRNFGGQSSQDEIDMRCDVSKKTLHEIFFDQIKDIYNTNNKWGLNTS